MNIQELDQGEVEIKKISKRIKNKEASLEDLENLE